MLSAGSIWVVDPTSGSVERRTIYRPQDVCEYAQPGAVRCAEPGTGPMPPRAVYEGAPVEPDPEIDAILAPAVARVAALKAEPIGVTITSPLTVRGEVESALGNLFVDAMLDVSGGADLVINNTDGGLRADVPAGPLTYGRLFEVFPFDNQIVELDDHRPRPRADSRSTHRAQPKFCSDLPADGSRPRVRRAR